MLYQCYTIIREMNKFSYKITLRKERVLTNGESPVCLLLIYLRKNRRVSLNISTKPQNWDERNQVVKKGDPAYERKNKLITIYKNRISSYETDCIIKNKPFILEKAVNCLAGNHDEQSFFNYVAKEWHNFESSLKPQTINKYRSHLNVLKTFRSNLSFSEIDIAFLRSYETYLATIRGNGKNTIGKALKWIKTIINQAMRDNIITTSPFSNYKITSEPGTREHLTITEIDRLEKLYLSSNLSFNMQESLRAFLFCCYTGLRLSDMKTLSYNAIQEGIITAIMHKTEYMVFIPLITRAKVLLSNRREGLVFHPVSDHMLNKHLAKIIKMAKINKKITFHCSRHSFATNSLNMGIPKDTVQKILGHQNIKTTDIYTKYTVSYLKKEMKKWDKPYR